MQQKTCIKCQRIKALTEFKLRADGKQTLKLNGVPRETNVCWNCRSLQKKSTYRTPIGKLRYIYKHQIQNSKSRGHSTPSYSEQEFIDKFINDPKYIALYTTWKNSGFLTDVAPSIDRLDDTKGYSFENIQLVTWIENNTKEHTKHREGTSINEDLKPVWQYTMQGEFVNYFISQNEAARQVDTVTQQTISLCCKGDTNSSGSFRWFYTEQHNLSPLEGYSYYYKVYEYSLVTKCLVNEYSSIEEITDSKSTQISIRRAIRNKIPYKERMFSLEVLSYEDLQILVKSLKSISPIAVYDLEYNLLSYYKSANVAAKALNIADTTIKRYAISKKPYDNYIFRLKFDDDIAENRFNLVNAKHLHI